MKLPDVTKASKPSESPAAGLTEADWYDLSIDWNARLSRELPVLMDVFGPPGKGGLLDAGCGTGHQARALAQHGYRVVAADISGEMLSVARRGAAGIESPPSFVESAYADLSAKVGGGFDGIYCLANSLAAAGSCEAAQEAVHQFARCLRPEGRLFIQVLNFDPMRRETPCIRGPRVTVVDGVEYVSTRQFSFVGSLCQVTNVTCWRDGAWRFHAHARSLYPVSRDELLAWSCESGLRVENCWASYQRDPFVIERPTDLILVATRR